jgi:hypothetical protein
MFFTQHLLPDPERFLAEQFGFGVLAHILVQPAQVIEALRRVRMFRAQDFLPDPERFLVDLFGLGVVPGIPEKVPKVI